jgi:putative hydrolase of the HAD superfamily
MIRGLIFDLGSTLIRFEGDWKQVRLDGIQAMLHQLRQDGIDLEHEAFANAFIEELDASYVEREADHVERRTSSLLRVVMNQFGHGDVPDDMMNRALAALYSEGENHWSPMPGVYEVLDSLHQEGFRLGIISNAGDEDNVQRLVDNAKVRSYFEPIVISAAVGIRKPEGRIFEMVLEEWDLPAQEVVMVGDTLRADILGAQWAGLHHIWLTADADSESNRADAKRIIPEAIAEQFTDIPALIQRWNNEKPEG